jgi:nitrous oxide reductase accessory protein NosL
MLMAKSKVSLVIILTVFLSVAGFSYAMEQATTEVEYVNSLPMHPMKNAQQYSEHQECEICGMNRNMWARTRHSFKDGKGEHYTCSIHCVAVSAKRSGERPEDVKVSDYLHPERMLSAEKAFYVVGSKARGTMSMTSKLAFSSQPGAESFVKKYGGQVVDFSHAYAMAVEESGKGMGHGGMGMHKGKGHGAMMQ